MPQLSEAARHPRANRQKRAARCGIARSFRFCTEREVELKKLQLDTESKIASLRLGLGDQPNAGVENKLRRSKRSRRPRKTPSISKAIKRDRAKRRGGKICSHRAGPERTRLETDARAAEESLKRIVELKGSEAQKTKAQSNFSKTQNALEKNAPILHLRMIPRLRERRATTKSQRSNCKDKIFRQTFSKPRSNRGEDRAVFTRSEKRTRRQAAIAGKLDIVKALGQRSAKARRKLKPAQPRKRKTGKIRARAGAAQRRSRPRKAAREAR